MHTHPTPSRSTAFAAARNCAARVLFCAALASCASLLTFAQPPLPQPQATATCSVEGMVRDASGKPVAGASVLLVAPGNAKPHETKSAEGGTFSFSALSAGAFTISAEKIGLRPSVSFSLELSAGEKKHVELILDPLDPSTGAAGHPAPDGASAAMEFSDHPDFVIAGMTDWSNLGLHGSDATARTSETLAKETLALKSGAAQESLANSGADAATVHRLSGDREERSGDPVAAVRDYEQATRLNPSEENYFAWGTELLSHRASQPAAEVFTKGFALHPQSARLLAGLGAALYANGLYREAAARLCEASDLNPADSAPYLFLGKMEEAAVDPVPCAEEKLARFAREQPGNALANYDYAISVWKRKRQSDDATEFRKTESLLEKAVAIDPTFAEAYLQLGVMYSAQGDPARTEQLLRKAIEINPQLSEAHRRLGQAYQRSGENTKAEHEFAIYKQCQKTESDALERERRELRQFLVILQDQPATSVPH